MEKLTKNYVLYRVAEIKQTYRQYETLRKTTLKPRAYKLIVSPEQVGIAGTRC